MNENTTVIEQGQRFTAFDLYDMADVLPDNMLYSCVQYCEFLGWHENGQQVRVKDVISGSDMWANHSDVTVMCAGWVIPDMRSVAVRMVA